ncbi:MAG: hypothetical protein V4469_02185 [Patescibacteria group bacterium]
MPAFVVLPIWLGAAFFHFLNEYSVEYKSHYASVDSILCTLSMDIGGVFIITSLFYLVVMISQLGFKKEIMHTIFYQIPLFSILIGGFMIFVNRGRGLDTLGPGLLWLVMTVPPLFFAVCYFISNWIEKKLRILVLIGGTVLLFSLIGICYIYEYKEKDEPQVYNACIADSEFGRS